MYWYLHLEGESLVLIDGVAYDESIMPDSAIIGRSRPQSREPDLEAGEGKKDDR